MIESFSMLSVIFFLNGKEDHEARSFGIAISPAKRPRKFIKETSKALEKDTKRIQRSHANNQGNAKQPKTKRQHQKTKTQRKHIIQTANTQGEQLVDVKRSLNPSFHIQLKFGFPITDPENREALDARVLESAKK